MSKAIVVITTADLKNKVAPSAEAMGPLVSALAEVNGRANRFTYTAEDVVEIARKAEKRLDQAGLPMADRVGFTVTAGSGGPSANAYKFKATGTEVTLRPASKGWAFVEGRQTTVYPKQPQRVRYAAPAKMVEEIARRSVDDIEAIAA